MGLKDDLSDDRKVEAVVAAFKEAAGLHHFVKPTVGPDTRASCLEFYDLQSTLGTGLKQLMACALGFYSKEWCRETFGVAHPPLTITVSRKSRAQVSRALSLKPEEKQTPEQYAALGWEMAQNLTALVGAAEAKKLVEATEGWPEDSDLRAALLAALSENEKK